MKPNTPTFHFRCNAFSMGIWAAALACLGGDGGDPARAAAASQLSAAGRLDLGRALLQGKPERHPQALALGGLLLVPSSGLLCELV